ncbi:hypothetical protein AC579_1715 [Pseudocercospora musae]|uniref:Uncharacterized protein n=1 Tax=Pseudocercospora musae TaxID=113226 RepID=A0A139ICB9_9PEZI|nr:hypothetical protein AC579_1715 [Pseudocercospora musae]
MHRTIDALNTLLHLLSKVIPKDTDEELLETPDDSPDEEGEADESGSIALVEPSGNQLTSDSSSLPWHMIQLDHDEDAGLAPEPASDESTSPSNANAPGNYRIYDFERDEVQSEDVCEYPDCFNAHRCDCGRCACRHHPKVLQDMDRKVFTLAGHGDADDIGALRP